MEKRQEVNINHKDFINLINKGDENAFEVLFRLYYDKLLHLSMGYLGSSQDAEEVVQNVFLKIWKKKETIKFLSSSFFFTITKNACLDYLRHLKMVQEKTRNYHDHILSNPIPFAQNEAASKILETELNNKILESIELLPEKCKNVFVKSRMEGMQNQEIADVLGLSKRTVETHIYLALKHLRLQLKDFIAMLL